MERSELLKLVECFNLLFSFKVSLDATNLLRMKELTLLCLSLTLERPIIEKNFRAFGNFVVRFNTGGSSQVTHNLGGIEKVDLLRIHPPKNSINCKYFLKFSF